MVTATRIEVRTLCVIISYGIFTSYLISKNYTELSQTQYNKFYGIRHYFYAVTVFDTICNFRNKFRPENLLFAELLSPPPHNFRMNSVHVSIIWNSSKICKCANPEIKNIYIYISIFIVDKKNQLDITFCILYFSSNSCSTCFGQPCAHNQELTIA